MPSPIDIFLSPAALVCLMILVALMAWEFALPARQLPRVPYWQARGLAAFVIYFLLASWLPLLWDATLAQYRLMNIAAVLPIWAQALAGLLTYEFALYWWHRSMHASPWLWRSFHQFHHSAERLDTFGAFWMSPLDAAGFTFVGSLALTFVLGASVEAATFVLYATFFLSVFQHANVSTPRWVGFVVQRPESHSRHHGRGVHRDNYSDLAVFDLLFGTFCNPEVHQQTGFYHGASSRVLAMLTWRDVHAAPQTRRRNAISVTE